MFVSDRLYMLPEVQEVNRLPMHGAEIPYADADQARAGVRETSPWFRSLDGEWDFLLYHCPEEVPAEIFTADSRKKMETIQVPSNWTLSGRFDKPIYTNVVMPAGFPVQPELPRENPTGIYRRTFRIPKTWRDRRIVLHVGGAESYLEVYLNGRFVGMGKDTRLPSEFDLTPFADFQQENVLVCRVIRWSDSSFIEDQDQWWMAGIYRSVYLYSTAYTYCADLFCHGDYDCAAGSGTLRVETRLGFDLDHWLSRKGGGAPVGPTRDLSVVSTLYDRTGKQVWRMQSAVDHRFRRSEDRCIQTGTLKKAAPWSAEEPNLYTLTVELFDDGGALLDVRRKRVGFRNVRIVGRDLLFNGQRVLIRGVNRHEHDWRTGKTLSEEAMLADIRLLKQYNFNAVRTCHYPDDHRWYDLCDEYGIYVLDEANAECHAYYPRLTRDPRWKTSFVSRAERMVLRDRSCTCIYSWSLGNESGHGENHLAAAAAVAALDSTRPVHHEGELKSHWDQGGNECSGGNSRCNAFTNPMYPTLEFLRTCSEKGDRPVIPCEYAHAMGNSSGSLCDYWDLFYTLPGLQGGFIWDWIDQGLLGKDKKGRPMIAYGGDFGEKRHDLDFNCNGMIACDHRIHPAMNEFRHLTQPVKVEPVPGKPFSFRLTSRRNFTTLGDLAGEWTLEIAGEAVRQGTLAGLSRIKPGAAMTFALPLETQTVPSGEEAFLNFRFTLKKENAWAPAGTLLAHDQLEMTAFLKQKKGKTTAKALPFALEKGKETFRLRSGDAVLTIDRKTAEGTLTKHGKTVLTEWFDSNLFRAGTDNDGIRGWTGQEDKPLGQWLAAGLDRLTVRSVKVTGSASRTAASLSIEKRLTGTDRKAVLLFRQTVTAANGGFVLRQDWEIPDNFPTLPRVGVLAAAPAGFEAVEWFGRGPWENYTDRKRSAQIGKYRNTVKGMYEDTYVMPQENGNRTDVRYLILSSKNAAVKISSARPFEFGVSHCTPCDLFAAFHQCELKLRKETILTVDYAQRGLGTGSCGPQTLSAYALDRKRYALEFLLEIL